MAVRLQDVAEHAGVSMKTVSNVVRNAPHVSDGMRLRVQRAIDELDYRPNMLGRRLATGKTGFLALAFADVRVPYYAELTRVVSRQAELAGYRLLLEETSASIEGERAVVASSEAGMVDGILFHPSVMSSGEIAAHRGEIPMVLLGEAAAPLTIDRVMVDNVGAAAEVTRLLIDEGRQRIAFLGHEASALTETSRQRIRGYQNALEADGRIPDPSLLVPSDSISAAGAAAAMGRALDAGLRVDGLVCRDDLAAFGALRALQERGLGVPHDVSVTGWDDIPISAVSYPSLTTVSPDLETLAARAMAMLVERMAGYDGTGRHEIAPHRVVRRESTDGE